MLHAQRPATSDRIKILMILNLNNWFFLGLRFSNYVLMFDSSVVLFRIRIRGVCLC